MTRRPSGFAPAVTIVALLLSLLAPSPPALACPSCATREGPGALTYLFIALMIAAPYAIALVTIRVVRRLERSP